MGDFIRALQFPETPEDKEGFRALRLALEDRTSSKLIRAAQDVLTLLSQARERKLPGLDAVLDDIELRARVELAKFGRAGVPLYLVYGAKGGDPAILPSILTEGVVVKALDAAGKTS